MKKKYFEVFKILFSFSLLGFLISKIDFKSLINIIKGLDVFYFVIGIIFLILCWVINSYKWQGLLNYFNLKKSLFVLFRLNLLCIFYSAVLPGGQVTGETIKCCTICANNKDKGKLIFSIVMDRITGMIALVIIGLVGIIFSTSYISNKISIIFFFAIILSGTFLFMLFFNNEFLLFFERFYYRLDKKIENGKIKSLLAKFVELFFLYKGAYSVLFRAIIWGIVFQAVNFFSVYILVLSLRFHVGILDIFWINALVCFVLLMPITVMGLGLREGGFIFLLGLLGVSEINSISLSLMVSFLYLFLGALGWFFELPKLFCLARD